MLLLVILLQLLLLLLLVILLQLLLLLLFPILLLLLLLLLFLILLQLLLVGVAVFVVAADGSVVLAGDETVAHAPSLEKSLPYLYGNYA